MTDAAELDETAIRARWTPPKRDDFEGPGAEIAHSLALMQWSLSRGTEARTDLPAALDEITRLRAALDEALDELAECRSFISVETRHYPTVWAINEVVERLRPLATPTTTERSESDD